MRQFRIDHIVNPVGVPETSDLHRAQPVTFEALRVAAEYAGPDIDVRLWSAQYPEDRQQVPSWIRATAELDRSVQDLGAFETDRKLPVLADILQRLASVSEGADLLVYTNVDIAVLPTFYRTIARTFEKGVDGCVINRRTIEDRYGGVDDLPLMYSAVGRQHPGRDCFVFTPRSLDRFHLGEVVIGADWVGRVLTWNIMAFARDFRWYRDVHLSFHLGNERRWVDPRYDEYTDHNRREAARALRVLRPALEVKGGHPEIAADVPPRWRLENEPIARLLRSARRTRLRIRG